MKSRITIRPESEADFEAITEVTIDAFKALEISNHTEQFIVTALRAAGALTVSLVGEIDGRLVGHIAFSPVRISDGAQGWYGLGPLSVALQYQRQGIGTALMEQGLADLKSRNAHGCCVVGHPDYYRRFGFEKVDGLTTEGVPPEVFLALAFGGDTPRGAVRFHEAFAATG